MSTITRGAFASRLTTVSSTYAQEIQTEEFGMGLHDVLAQRAESLTGIVNAVDYDDWNPETDTRIPADFSIEDLSGKLKCKKALLDRFNLPLDTTVPLFGVVSRLTGQKGFDLLPDAVPVMLHEEGVRLVSNLVDVQLEAVTIGMPVEVVFDRVNGEIVLPKFRKAG